MLHFKHTNKYFLAILKLKISCPLFKNMTMIPQKNQNKKMKSQQNWMDNSNVTNVIKFVETTDLYYFTKDFMPHCPVKFVKNF